MGRRSMARRIAGLGACAALAGYLVAPRTGDRRVEARWAMLSRYRYAHRGLHDNQTRAPENSLAAFRLAREWGYGSELDVHLTADGKLAVIHDSRLMRACGVDALVEDLTLAQLQKLRLFGTAERIPSLAQVLEAYERPLVDANGEAVPGEVPPLIVELKVHASNYAELTRLTLEELDRHVVPYCVESFDPRTLWWLRSNRPDVVRGQLSENFPLDAGSDVGLLRGAAHASLMHDVLARPDFVAYRFEHRGHPSVRLACDVLGARRVWWTVASPASLAASDAEGAVSIFEAFMPAPTRT